MPDREERHLLPKDLGSGEPNPGLRPIKKGILALREPVVVSIYFITILRNENPLMYYQWHDLFLFTILRNENPLV